MNRIIFVVTLLGLLPSFTVANDTLHQDAKRALRRACDYFDQAVSCEGGYLWQYSRDLKRREGEGDASVTQVWNKRPGTPFVGEALLNAYERTGDEHYLQLARRTAMALVRGQLVSGGWDYKIEFDPELRKKYAYRVEQPRPNSKLFNVTTLDDNTTQGVLRYLMRFDAVTKFKDTAIHDAVEYALTQLIAAQYPNGAWPQRYAELPDASQFPVKKAAYPESWSRTFPAVKYNSHYTFNDAAMLDVIDVLFIAARTYEQPKYRAAAEKCGDFIILAQMPEPQPAWAQQYDADMHPAWARKFEPPSVTGGESQKILEGLIQLYRQTGEKRFLAPIPSAVAYLKRSLIDDRRLARFYELKTNRPLYFTKQYELTYDDSDLPTHYGFKIDSKLDRIEKAYADVTAKPW
ncbi:MAG: pectic acid lyase, partial [Planctomycetaceae bacterium]|nr:pectic acid lyase [Planctomycetaceae bacterium]